MITHKTLRAVFKVATQVPAPIAVTTVGFNMRLHQCLRINWTIAFTFDVDDYAFCVYRLNREFTDEDFTVRGAVEADLAAGGEAKRVRGYPPNKCYSHESNFDFLVILGSSKTLYN
ncbi:hypothetical protein Lal_00004787 [Lupinus albus]|nr:hypothetical protein Lal_00004787 [Lupinus albus]